MTALKCEPSFCFYHRNPHPSLNFSYSLTIYLLKHKMNNFKTKLVEECLITCCVFFRAKYDTLFLTRRKCNSWHCCLRTDPDPQQKFNCKSFSLLKLLLNYTIFTTTSPFSFLNGNLMTLYTCKLIDTSVFSIFPQNNNCKQHFIY